MTLADAPHRDVPVRDDADQVHGLPIVDDRNEAHLVFAHEPGGDPQVGFRCRNRGE